MNQKSTLTNLGVDINLSGKSAAMLAIGLSTPIVVYFIFKIATT